MDMLHLFIYAFLFIILFLFMQLIVLFMQLFMPLSGKHDRTHSANVIIPHVMSLTLLVYSKHIVRIW